MKAHVFLDSVLPRHIPDVFLFAWQSLHPSNNCDNSNIPVTDGAQQLSNTQQFLALKEGDPGMVFCLLPH